MNKRLKKIKLNPVRYYSHLIKNDSQGIDLTMGEGHFNSPFQAKLKAYEALINNQTKYGLIEGDLNLREKIIEKYYPAYNPETEIIITNGSTQALFSVLSGIISSRNDEIIIIGPYYPVYFHIVTLLGAKPIVIDSRQTNFKISIDCLKAKVTSHTRALIINEPNNPTGITYTKEEKACLIEYIKENNFFVVVDEIYREFTDESFVSFSELINKEVKDQFIFVNGLSKSHMMTGYRIGYIISNEQMNHEFRKINYLSVSCISAIMQQAAIGALDEDEFVEFVRKYYLNNTSILKEALDEFNIRYVQSTCGYYIFMDVSPYNLTGEGFCKVFSKEYHVALVPGNVFGEDYKSYVRISCCRDISEISKLIEYLLKFIELR